MMGYSAQHSIGIAVVLTLSYQDLSSQLTRCVPQKSVAALLKKNSKRKQFFLQKLQYMCSFHYGRIHSTQTTKISIQHATYHRSHPQKCVWKSQMKLKICKSITKSIPTHPTQTAPAGYKPGKKPVPFWFSLRIQMPHSIKHETVS